MMCCLNRRKRLPGWMLLLAALPVAPYAGHAWAQTERANGYGEFPFQFEANRGQADPAFEFLAHGPGYGLLLKPGEAVLRLKAGDQETDRATALRMALMGANPKAALNADAPLPGKVNYLRGRDPKQWKTGIPTYARVKASGIYPGIDLVYYGNPKQLEYDFVVQPGADPKQIRWRFETLGRGAASLPRVDARGELVVPGAGGDLRFHKPVIYQTVQGRKRPVEGRFVVRPSESDRAALVSFEVGRYDPTQTLVIDPVLAYSTYLGGDRSEDGKAIAVDGSGNAYVAGVAEFGFPTTAGAYDTTYNGDKDAFVAKIDANGASLIYATYLGGSGVGGLNSSGNDEITAIAVDASGSAYVGGKTSNADFPTTPGVFYPNCGGDFVAKLNPAGSDLVYSTCVRALSVRGIAVDGAGYAYIAGSSGGCSPNNGCPLTAGAYDTTQNGGSDVFVGKLNPTATGFVFGTLIGGQRDDIGRGVAVDSLGNVYVTGNTKSPDFPTTVGALDTDYNDADLNRDSDAFVAKVDPTGAALAYSTYLGGLDEDSGRAIAVDGAGNAYVGGTTESANFPTTAGAFDTSYNSVSSLSAEDGFVAKLNPAGTALAYSTYLGGNIADEVYAIAVDAQGNAHVAGYTRSSDFPLVNAVDGTLGGDSWEAFVTKLDAAGTSLLYSTYLGGDSVDVGNAIALDSVGNAYVTGNTAAANFPTTVGALDTVNNGFDAFVVKLVDSVPPPGTTPPGTNPPGTTPPGTQPPGTTPPEQNPTVSADLSLKAAAKRRIKAGQWLTYRLTASNKTRRVVAPGVKVSAQLPDAVSAIRVPSFCSQSGATLVCALGNIKARNTKAFSIKIRPGGSGQIVFQASVSGFVKDTNSANDSVNLITRVR